MGNECGLLFLKERGITDIFRDHAKFGNIPPTDNSTCNICLSECSCTYILNYFLFFLSLLSNIVFRLVLCC